VHPKTNNNYVSQVRVDCGHILPFLSFLGFFFFLSLSSQNTQWNDRRTSANTAETSPVLAIHYIISYVKYIYITFTGASMLLYYNEIDLASTNEEYVNMGL